VLILLNNNRLDTPDTPLLPPGVLFITH